MNPYDMASCEEELNCSSGEIEEEIAEQDEKWKRNECLNVCKVCEKAKESVNEDFVCKECEDKNE